jgi:mannosyltransferase OCH1-like enzyme
MNMEIPKVIHYCWFGGNPLTELSKKCIESWRKYCPDYEIKEWNESNFDVHCCAYVKEAYEAKKWAFVSDYARYKILFENGGVYLDTDVELLRPLDEIVNKGNYFGCENHTTERMCVNPGVGCASVPGHAFYSKILADYEKSNFKNEDGTLNLYTVVQRTTDFLEKQGLNKSLEIQKIGDITIYPAEYFSPKDMRDGKLRITTNSYSIHHYVASWHSKKTILYGKVLRFLYKCVGEKRFNTIRRIFKRDKKSK